MPLVVQPRIYEAYDEVWLSAWSGRQVAFLDIQQRPFSERVRRVPAAVRVTDPATLRVMPRLVVEGAVEHEDFLAAGVHMIRVRGIGRPSQQEDILRRRGRAPGSTRPCRYRRRAVSCRRRQTGAA